ncbi:MAG TPA: hypothetical protein VLC09_10260 [Polyangiaceae bacterium]|nr:hypothetical protein [Polyangiaceae bacterium]
MKRTITRGASFLCAVALLAAAATPASGAAPPPGKGLVDFGTFTCGGLGDVDLVGPRGLKAASGWTITGETAEHISLLSLEITGIDFDGNPIDIEQTYGKKSAMTTFTCTQHFEEDGAIVDVTAVAGLVPSQ